MPIRGRSSSTDQVFAALANPTRRDVLDLLREGARPVQDIAARFDMARPSVSEHLKVLRDAGLVNAARAAARVFRAGRAAGRPGALALTVRTVLACITQRPAQFLGQRGDIVTEADRTVITVEEFLPYPAARVWQALTDPDKLTVWFMPNDFKPVVGHTFHFHRTANCELHFSDRILCRVSRSVTNSCCPTPGPMPSMRASSNQ
jgi:DNA-binding transcriptional ArsR family regulator